MPQSPSRFRGSLCKAAADGNIALVRKLLAVNHGQYALELDRKGYSPLMHAARRGDLPMVRLLLATNLYDAHNVSIKSRSGNTSQAGSDGPTPAGAWC
ncbi:ankyrin repeat-containing protein [Nannochloropsis gaditana CCMP526]|uniref:ankyrin repeat-containing protein n=1 Tax=Nannochloropsis gaditana (strain CCMP526) TaxID=1093141 RepID=UPI00029F69DC|nr:ankyrin repeat-containing protein [Nannochloropsis gaditana CCMP526]EKU22966.1 ankyrin repeat-containing protein [Nannochloropsis gaditana CCMP526]|eukprot:XP_005853395.1 ankyrin repeat-containing protein [Nannochloropsis gaditana CCMP526]